MLCLNTDPNGGKQCGFECKKSQFRDHAASCGLRLVVCQEGCESEICCRDIATHKCIAHLKKKVETITGIKSILKSQHSTHFTSHKRCFIERLERVIQTNDLFAERFERLESKVLRFISNVVISGATGSCAHLINGLWDRSEEVVDGMPVYFKRDDRDECLEYYATDRSWYIRALANRGTNAGHAFVDCNPAGPAEECTGTWRVLSNDKWEDQPSVRVAKCNYE